MIPPFSPIRAAAGPVTPELLNRVQDALKKTLDPLPAIALLNGVLVQGATLNGASQVAHTLGRAPLGWIPVRPRGAAATYFETQAPDANFLYITTSAAVTCDFWVF